MATKRPDKAYRDASFRGVKFLVEAHEAGFGRRTADHEYPERDTPHSQDLGRKVNDFTLEAFVVGDDYIDRGKALIAACTEKGPGRLVHPHYGSLQVVCKPSRVKWEKNKLRKLTLTLNFLESGEVDFEPVKDPISSMLSAVAGLLAAASNEFESVFSVVDKASHVADFAQAKVDELTDLMDTASQGIKNRTAAVTELAFKLRTIKADVLDLIHLPGQLASRFVDAFGLFATLVPNGDSQAVIDAITPFLKYGVAFTTAPSTTDSQKQNGTNQGALVSFIRRAAVATVAQAAVNGTYASLDDAILMQATVTDTIDDELEKTKSDDTFLALETLRAETVFSLPAAGEDLPELVTVTPAETVPSLVLAHELYKSLDLESDIASRNRVRHPGFLPGGKPLTVVKGPGVTNG